MPKTIIVNIKFDKDTKSGKVFGFVTRCNGDWRGCRVNDNISKRKIVMPGYQVSDSIVPGVLYHSTLLPMSGGKEGFIAIKASPIQFPGKIETEFAGEKPVLTLKFGIKKIIYDPASQDPKYSSLEDIISHIGHRYDLADAYNVSRRFGYAALTLQQEYKSQNHD